MWIDRNKAAQARIQNRIRLTPKSEIAAGLVQFNADQAEVAAQSRLVEKLKGKAGKAVKSTEGELNLDALKKEFDRDIKIEKPKSNQKVTKPKGDPHVHDFFEAGDD